MAEIGGTERLIWQQNARIKELRTELAEMTAGYVRQMTTMAELLRAVRAVEAENEEVGTRLAEVEAERDAAIELAEEVIPYAGEYFDEKWALTERLNELKVRAAALREDEK